MIIEPSATFNKVFKEGMKGWDVWTIQVSLNAAPLAPHLAEDGEFGTQTKSAVMKFQTNNHLTPDGICGMMTQTQLCRQACDRAQHGLTPDGLLRGLCEGESSNIIPETTPPYPNDGSRDYGAFQRHAVHPTYAQLRSYYNVTAAALLAAQVINEKYRGFKGMIGAKTDEAAWKLALLHHNWQSAAFALAEGLRDTWVYKSDDKYYHLADPAPWIENIGAPGVHTGLQWIDFYVNKKIVYVQDWSIAQ